MIYVNDIINVCKGTYLGEDTTILCKHFCNDTREISDGDVYVGIKGSVFNGNTFYKEAFNKGASLCILDDESVIDENDKTKNIILVNDSIETIQVLAKYKRSLYDIPVVAVTGSVGKTSVKDMIHCVLAKKYNVLCNKGNKNNHIGMPLTILDLDKHDALIVEMGMNNLGEIHTLTNIAKPTIGVITNVGTAHIGNLGSRENILKAKLEITDGLGNGHLVINNDNDLLHTVKYDNLITIGIDNYSDYMAKDISINDSSCSFCIDDNYMNLPVSSMAFVYNALLAYAVGIKLGISSLEIEDALENMTLTPHRLEVVKKDKLTIIDDTYNASYDSVKNAILVLDKYKNRKVFIFADILELDSFGEEIHRNIGDLVNNSNINLLITVGNLSKYTSLVVRNNNDCLEYHFDNNKDLIDNLDILLKDNDTVLIKGSNGMKLIEIVDYLKNKY